MQKRLLLLEPSAAAADTLATLLKRDGHDVRVVADLPRATATLTATAFDGVLVSLDGLAGKGLAAVRELADLDNAGSLIALTAQGSVQFAVDVMRAGAIDVVLLPASADKLRSAVGLLGQGATRGVGKQTRPKEGPDTGPDMGDEGYFGFIGGCPAMRNVYRMIDSAAPSRATVFITGESGTGKEVCADAIHRCSPRSSGPFIAINCAAIPKDLMESEIFGHVKGAFTGAAADHAGAALQANGGTLFLDEICEMDLSLQAKLLRFLQTGLVKKVGSERTQAVDVRIVCATNRDPQAEVQAGRFREDLFYRLQVISIELPPLRDRGEDILIIARAFLKQFSDEERKAFRGYSQECEQILAGYGWPGNVRQLLNVVRNVVVLNDGEEVKPFMLPPPLNKPTLIVPPILKDPRWLAMTGPLPFALESMAEQPSPMAPARGTPVFTGGPTVAPAEDQDGDVSSIRPLWQVEQEAIDRAVRLCDGNITRAAALLEINPCTIYRRRQKQRVTGPAARGMR